MKSMRLKKKRLEAKAKAKAHEGEGYLWTGFGSLGVRHFGAPLKKMHAKIPSPLVPGSLVAF